MKNLWSPWRSKYIESFSGKKESEGCIFCNMLSCNPYSEDNLVVEIDKHSMVVMNLYPYNNGHLMIVPKRHLSKFSELNDDELLECNKKLQVYEKILSELINPDGFNIGVNLGRVSGAGIDDHIHFHLVPRWNGDTNFMPVLGEVKVISQDLLTLKKMLLNSLEKRKKSEV
ncbi:MAG: HIT domain-containing protein [Ignavibacterium sp.]|nr:HIT domain-containing protein [Ignavibacterium sp.]MDW8376249.1 HIT domain-containing protein [Ignavibacteriales bacterium]